MNLFAILLLVGLLDCITVIAFYFVYNRSDWPTADGIVKKTFVDKTKAGKYKPVIEYEYQVKGQPYTCNQIAVLSPITNNQSGAQKICDQYPVEKSITVYHDPHQPEKAVLNPNLPLPFIIMLVVGILFILVGTIGVLY